MERIVDSFSRLPHRFTTRNAKVILLMLWTVVGFLCGILVYAVVRVVITGFYTVSLISELY